MDYVGRFAPSPTGPLHAGSVATAVASYLHARQHDGRWLLRIDDIDPPRIVPGSADAIVALLDSLQLHWDGEVCLQSRRRDAHAAAADDLLARSLAYRCDCSRRELLAEQKPGMLGIRYDGRCRVSGVTKSDSAIRVQIDTDRVTFTDELQGERSIDLLHELGDYIVFRRDGLPAYHLACVLDDAEHGVTDIVRGCDLLPATSVHVHLQSVLGLAQPRYWHVPVLCDEHGSKLAKRHRAASVSGKPVRTIAHAALQHIGAAPPVELAMEQPEVQWQWAIEHWRIECLRGVEKRPVATTV